MTNNKKILTIVGARPQFIKAAPLSRALTRDFKEILVHTGQHYDQGMSDVFFKEMKINEPDFNLGIGGGSHGEQTGKMLIGLEKVINETKPDCVLVYGDTNSTLAGALTAAKMQIPLAHVEAGLRSFNRAMPEEINRIVADSLSALLFCPTDTAIKNLEKEGVTKGVHQVGDVMYDALLQNLEIARKHSQILNTHELQKGEYALATVHRAANTDNRERMVAILSAFSKMKTRIVFPVHPRAKKMMQEWDLKPAANIVLIEPVGRFDMLVLQENANCILTDSGGVQKEAYFAGVRCVTLREETEWIETVQAGWNKLTGVVEAEILSAFENWHPQGNRPELYGDGDSSGKISAILKSYLL